MKTTRGRKVAGYVMCGVLLCGGVVLSAPQSAQADHRHWLGAGHGDGFIALVKGLHHGHRPAMHVRHAQKWENKRDKYQKKADFFSENGFDRRGRRFTRKAARADQRRERQLSFVETERQARRDMRAQVRERRGNHRDRDRDREHDGGSCNGRH